MSYKIFAAPGFPSIVTEGQIRFSFCLYSDKAVPTFDRLFQERDNIRRYLADNTAATFSPLLIDQLTWMECGQPFLSGSHIIENYSFDVVNAILAQAYSKSTATKPARPFTRVLMGYYHLHVKNSRSIYYVLKKAYTGKRGDRRFEEMLSHSGKFDIPYPSDPHPDDIAMRSMLFALECATNERRWTGDWLIYRDNQGMMDTRAYVAHPLKNEDESYILELLDNAESSFIDLAFDLHQKTTGKADLKSW